MNTLKYQVRIFGYNVNLVVLALVVAVVVGLVLYRQQLTASAPSMGVSDTLSSTSQSGGLASIYRQMGGGALSMSTPDFIRRLQ